MEYLLRICQDSKRILKIFFRTEKYKLQALKTKKKAYKALGIVQLKTTKSHYSFLQVA